MSLLDILEPSISYIGKKRGGKDKNRRTLRSRRRENKKKKKKTKKLSVPPHSRRTV